MKFTLLIVTQLMLVPLISLAQEGGTPLPETTPRPATNRTYFPINLHCQYSDTSDMGPTWRGITIGQSTLDDLDLIITDLNKTYETEGLQSSQILYYTFDYADVDVNGLSRGIRACIVDNRVQLLDILLLTDNPDFQQTIEGFVIQYGIPDTVTWSHLRGARLAFWFEEGIVVAFSINPINSGEVSSIVYIPYQDIEGYEDRWPYNQTRPEAAPQGDYFPDPPIPVEQNPFDFDAMLATITAQPTRTLTPTLTPRASATIEITATPTP